MKKLNDCFCCEGVRVETPVRIDNRAGLSQISCRVGVHSRFKSSLLARLSSVDYLPLHDLQTRENGDFSIALLDAWAVMADVLTFYNERFAQESYLRTATERRSLVSLAQLIGYRPHPGLAAYTYLAFTVNNGRHLTLNAGTRAQSVPGPDELPQTFETDVEIEVRADWNAMRPRLTAPQRIVFGTTEIYLKGTDLRLRKGDSLLFVGQERADSPISNRWDLRRIESVEVLDDYNSTYVTWKKGLGSLYPRKQPAQDPEVYVLRTRGALFAHNAADWASMTPEFKIEYKKSHSGDATTETEWPGFEKIFKHVEHGYNRKYKHYQIDLDAAYPMVERGSWLVLLAPGYTELYGVMGATIISHAEFNLSSRTTRLHLDTNENADKFSRRGTLVLAESVRLTMAEKPIVQLERVNEIKLEDQVKGLRKGQSIVISGKDTQGKLQSELAVVTRIKSNSARLTLRLKNRLKHRYLRESVTINANVVRATHGESVEEVLGSGNASVTAQRFKLKQKPLTYTDSSINPNGVQSSLELRVDGVRWREIDNLLTQKVGEQSYMTYSTEEGETTVQFAANARPSSGQENITASYRKGIGRNGLVKQGVISLLPIRPLGIREVNNVVPSKDAQDPEPREQIQQNAPLTVLTLDRLVSLKDYADFARAFAGIEKAVATWSWIGERRGVLLSVAGTDGAAVTFESAEALGTRLMTVMKRYSPPFVPLMINSYQKVLFKLSATLVIDADYSPKTVLVEVRRRLDEAFSFANRQLGYSIAMSEVLSVMQSHVAVHAVDVDFLYRASHRPSLNSILRAESPRVGARGNILSGAELLIIDADGINLRVQI